MFCYWNRPLFQGTSFRSALASSISGTSFRTVLAPGRPDGHGLGQKEGLRPVVLNPWPNDAKCLAFEKMFLTIFDLYIQESAYQNSVETPGLYVILVHLDPFPPQVCPTPWVSLVGSLHNQSSRPGHALVGWSPGTAEAHCEPPQSSGMYCLHCIYNKYIVCVVYTVRTNSIQYTVYDRLYMMYRI